jgi:hypothetical protein
VKVATDAQVKAGLSFETTRFDIPAKTVGDDQLVRIKAWLSEILGQDASSEDISCWMWTEINSRVVERENKARDAANTAAAVTDLTA